MDNYRRRGMTKVKDTNDHDSHFHSIYLCRDTTDQSYTQKISRVRKRKEALTQNISQFLIPKIKPGGYLQPILHTLSLNHVPKASLNSKLPGITPYSRHPISYLRGKILGSSPATQPGKFSCGHSTSRSILQAP